jgi:molybdopterin synthase sulfur carrier subunit
MIKVLLFAGLQEAVGKHEIMLAKDAISIQELKSELAEHYSQLPSLQNVMVAVNEEYSNDITQLISNGDVVALIPPVSGG